MCSAPHCKIIKHMRRQSPATTGVVQDPARAAKLGLPPRRHSADASASPARNQVTPDRWGVELVRPGDAAAVTGPARAAAVAAMGEYGEALEELGSEEGEEEAAGGRTFGDVLRARFEAVGARLPVCTWRAARCRELLCVLLLPAGRCCSSTPCERET